MTMYFKVTYFTESGTTAAVYVDMFLQPEVGNPDICRLKIGEKYRIIKPDLGISSEWHRITKEQYAVSKL